MSALDRDPVDAAATQRLFAEALAQMRQQHWDPAMRLLEAAIVAAPLELRNPAVEILASIYVARNEHARLRNLMRWVDPSSPQMIKGALLLARNHAIGMDVEVPAHCDESSLGRALRAHIVAGAYQLGELPVIAALLAQLGWAELAGQTAMLCAAAGVGIEAGIVERVLAVLRASGRRDAALELVQALQAMPPSEQRPIERWKRLLGAGRPAAAGDAAGGDKVERFLQSAPLRRVA